MYFHKALDRKAIYMTLHVAVVLNNADVNNARSVVPFQIIKWQRQPMLKLLPTQQSEAGKTTV